MIIDYIKNAPVYFGVDPAIEEALRFLMNYDGPVDQRDVIRVSERVLVKICLYTTKDESECVFEAHKRYADIHYMVRGREMMAYASVEDMRVTSENEESDLVLLEGKGTKVPLNEGNFLIAFPQDAHLCAMMWDAPEPCCKLVAKVLLKGEVK